MNVLDLFSGIGGFSLGLERAGFKTVAFCEIDSFCRKVLRKHWPDVPIYGDIRELTGETLQQDGIVADIVTGGFPCQRFSSAARGRNNAEDYWPEMARLVSQIKPRIAICENVQFAPIAAAADHFCGLGMRCDVIRIPAYEVGADSQRSRWWAIAHTHAGGKLPRALNAEAQKLPTLRGCVWGAENYRAAIRLSDGVSNIMDEVRAFGNAVVPQIPELIGRAILEVENERL